MTDLLFYQGRWFCTFREGSHHRGGSNGIIRVITSSNTVVWEHAALIEEEHLDLRDPKLSITPDGRLMLLIGTVLTDAGYQYQAFQSKVLFSQDGFSWSPPQNATPIHHWLWRVTWFQGAAYGVSYRFSNIFNPQEEWTTHLWKSMDGIHYELITDFFIPGRPSEATVRFHPDGQMTILMRRDKLFARAWIGHSWEPYNDWIWHETPLYLGGPNFLILPDGKMWAGGRIFMISPYAFKEKTVLASMTENRLHTELILPSGGDSSYPGMVYHQNYLWMSYYSSHEEGTKIYLAKIRL